MSITKTLAKAKLHYHCCTLDRLDDLYQNGYINDETAEKTMRHHLVGAIAAMCKIHNKQPEQVVNAMFQTLKTIKD